MRWLRQLFGARGEERGAGKTEDKTPESSPVPSPLASPTSRFAPRPSPAWLVVGLGNPGARYAGTRHNAGFEVASRVAGPAPFAPSAHGADVADAVVAGHAGRVALPTTYMNKSGDAVAGLLAEAWLGADRLLVVVDDLSLPLGALRLRPRGGAGGHNGLASIEDVLGFADYPRLRVGIGNSFAPGFQAEFVLARFEPDEREAAAAAFERAASAIGTVVHSGVETAMTTLNRRS